MEPLHADAWAYDILEELDAIHDPVTDWEADFIESILRHKPRKLTAKQIGVIEKMKEKYLV